MHSTDRASISAFLAPTAPRCARVFESAFTGKCPQRRQLIVPLSRRRRDPVARVRRGFKPDPEIPTNLFDTKPIADIDYNLFDFTQLKGDVVLVSNVASHDDYTDSMYGMFASLLDKYQDSGFHVLAFPSNWYGQKEYDSLSGIKKLVREKYSEKIKLFCKTDIDWNQVFALGCSYFPGEIIWNFHGLFLFDRSGIPVERFDLLTTADYVEGRVRKQIYGGNSGDEEFMVVPEPPSDEVEAGVA